ncbi:MAG: Ig-like domain-containing protein, partial [Bacteroidota bacterium]
MNNHPVSILLIIGLMTGTMSCGPECGENNGTLQLVRVVAGGVLLDPNSPVSGIPVTAGISIEFSNAIDTIASRNNVSLNLDGNGSVACSVSFSANGTTISIDPASDLSYLTDYKLIIGSGLTGAQCETFPGVTYQFVTERGKLTIENITLNGKPFDSSNKLNDIDRQ